MAVAVADPPDIYSPWGILRRHQTNGRNGASNGGRISAKSLLAADSYVNSSQDLILPSPWDHIANLPIHLSTVCY